MGGGHNLYKDGQKPMYLTAIIDWYSRFIVGWALSDTLDTTPVIEAVALAIQKYGVPAIINSDQGSQFTSNEYVKLLRGIIFVRAWKAKPDG